jgi:hypothetical protein
VYSSLGTVRDPAEGAHQSKLSTPPRKSLARVTKKRRCSLRKRQGAANGRGFG